MNAGIGIGILFLVCIIAVIATIIYKTRQSSGPAASNLETLKINADGTVSFTESKKEYFLYTENGYETENGIKYTNDDPIHMRYYKNKATRSSMWNISADIRNTPCDEPDCVVVDTSDRATTTVLLNDLMDSIKPGLKDYQNYFKSKGLTKATYTRDVLANKALEGKFEFDILFKGYLEYKGIAVPEDLTILNYIESEFFKDIVNRFPVVNQWPIIDVVLNDQVLLKVKDNGKTALYIDNEGGEPNLIEMTIGTDIGVVRSVFLIGIIKTLAENKDIVGVLYDPPAVILSNKQINENYGNKTGYIIEEAK
jgi:hypothetical protein